jgi:hypothetical protein
VADIHQDPKVRQNVPLWTLIVSLSVAGLGWMTAAFVLGRVTPSDALRLGADYAYILAEAVFIGAAASLLLRYFVRGGTEGRLVALLLKLDNLVTTLYRSHTGPFVTQEQLPPIRTLIESAQEFFYIGGNCRALLQDYPNDLKRWVTEGKRLIFLIQDPDNEGLKYSEMPCADYNPAKYVEDSRRSIRVLEDLQRAGGSIELYLTKTTPTQSLAFADPNGSSARVSMFIHLPDGEIHTAPCITFTRADNPHWFQLFYDRYDGLRKRSKQILPAPSGTEVEPVTGSP